MYIKQLGVFHDKQKCIFLLAESAAKYKNHCKENKCTLYAIEYQFIGHVTQNGVVAESFWQEGKFKFVLAMKGLNIPSYTHYNVESLQTLKTIGQVFRNGTQQCYSSFQHVQVTREEKLDYYRPPHGTNVKHNDPRLSKQHEQRSTQQPSQHIRSQQNHFKQSKDKL